MGGLASTYERIVEQLTSRLASLEGGFADFTSSRFTADRINADLSAAAGLVRELRDLRQNLQVPRAEFAMDVAELRRQLRLAREQNSWFENRVTILQGELQRIGGENAQRMSNLVRENMTLRADRDALRAKLLVTKKQVKDEEKRGHAKRMYRGVPKKPRPQRK